MTTFYFLTFFIVCAVIKSAQADDYVREDQDPNDDEVSSLDLETVRSRIERQFNELETVGTGENTVAMSLVDALQRWADALEAQVGQTVYIGINMFQFFGLH